MTVQEIKSDDNFLCQLELPQIQVYLIYQGTGILKYYAYRNGEILFSGNDFKPSPMHNIDNVESCVELLGFLTVKEGDTDPEYFKDYTEAQMKWTRTQDCEYVSIMVGNFEEGFKKEMKKFFSL